MSVEAVIATQVIDTTTVGRSLMTAADAAAARTALSLGTLATQNGTISDYLTAATAASTYQTSLVSGASIKTVNGSSLLGSGDLTVSGLSGTGSVDNAALRADGTGGSTLQNSNLLISDLLTASPNNTINHICLEPTGGTTNVSVSVKPKGTGAFCLHAPDGATAGGNVRGANAVDLQRNRFAAADVASGSESFIGSGIGNRATGTYSAVLGGSSNNVSGQSGAALNEQNAVSGRAAAAFNGGNTASGNSSVATGTYSLADRVGMQSFAGGRFAATGDGQAVRFCLGGKTTSATPLTLRMTSISSSDGAGDYTSGSAIRLTIPSGKVASLMCRICGIKSDGSAVANYVRRVVIKNVGGTTSIVGSVETIGTDIEDNASTDVAITADNTNDALQINVTGITGETWRWVAAVEGLEIAYGA